MNTYGPVDFQKIKKSGHSLHHGHVQHVIHSWFRSSWFKICNNISIVFKILKLGTWIYVENVYKNI